MAIKLSHFSVFVAVAELGNITDAAAKIGRTPSAVSMTLRQLEDEVGGPLFESDRKSKLTSLGEYVLSVARPEVLGFERSVGNIKAYALNEVGRLDVACVPSIAAHVLPPLLDVFIRERPGIELNLRDTDSASVELAVERQNVELGVAGPPANMRIIEFEPLFGDRFLLVCATGNRLARQEKAGWRDLEGENFIVNGASERIEHPQYRELSARSRLQFPNVMSLLAVVRRNLGVTILPALSVPPGDPHLACVPLEVELPRREVGLLKRHGRALSPLATALADLLRRRLSAGGIDEGHPEPRTNRPA